jgi:NADH dehydrogenase [ubiquinone] 1 alpha subcomplex assembly factor 1
MRRIGFVVGARLVAGSVAVVAVVAIAVLPTPTLVAAATRSARIVDFTAEESPWQVVNDGVMGGVSTSRFTRTKGIATFRGQVRLENNGGFASIRSQDRLPSIPSAAKAFAIRLRGDGRSYQITVDTDLGWFWHSQPTVKARWSTVVIPFDRLVPVSRFGEPEERDSYQPDTHQLETLGVLISNKRREPFTIDIDWIEAR